MALVLEQLREWQDDTGPESWLAAWDRALELLAPLWPDRDMTWDGPVVADGGAALAMALYLIAGEAATAPELVTRAQVEHLARRRDGENDHAVGARWERRLRALGHDLADNDDPVSARWRVLCVDHSPPESAPHGVHMDSTHRWGPAFLEGIRYVLAPVWSHRLRF